MEVGTGNRHLRIHPAAEQRIFMTRESLACLHTSGASQLSLRNLNVLSAETRGGSLNVQEGSSFTCTRAPGVYERLEEAVDLISVPIKTSRAHAACLSKLRKDFYFCFCRMMMIRY